MITAILDTNVLVQSVISSPPSSSACVLDAYYDGKFRLIYSPSTLDELIDVLLVPHIRDRHGMSDDEVLEFVASLLAHAERRADDLVIPASVTRDPTDTKFLALAEDSGATYLVTNDRRHLLRLGHYQQTHIVTPAQFLRELA